MYKRVCYLILCTVLLFCEIGEASVYMPFSGSWISEEVVLLSLGQSLQLSDASLCQELPDGETHWQSADSLVVSVDPQGRACAGRVERVTEVTITAERTDGQCTLTRLHRIAVLPVAQKITLCVSGSPWPSQAIVADTSAIGSVLAVSGQAWPEEAPQAITMEVRSGDSARLLPDGQLEIVGKGTCALYLQSDDGEVLRKIPIIVEDMDDHPYYMEIDAGNQVVRVYEEDEQGYYSRLTRRMVCSTGKNSLKTGLYRMHSTRQSWITTILDGVMCQYGTRFREHFWFHSLPYQGYHRDRMDMAAYAQLGTNASHGCIRLLVADAKWIHDNVPAQTPIIYCKNDRDETEYGAVSWPAAQDGWDPTDPHPDNPYYDPSYTSELP